ncbi:MAG TPA: exo 1,3/1,4-beta-D-glucan glucohydrolase [Steroidobacteraceae bacterium]|nr:exo 1,3/1,4-beta-D-glucan glucohydrolase [Steroidobacteraceae bacterium]
MWIAKNEYSGVGVSERIALLVALGATLLGLFASAQAYGAQPRAVIHPDTWPQVRPQLPADPALERKVDALLAGMTLEQKVGQLIQGDISTLTPADLREYPLGSVLNGGNSKPGGNTLAPPSAWLDLANRFYLASMAPSQGSHPIPEFWGIDAVHGNNDVYGATVFPQNVGLGAAHDPALMRLIGGVTAAEVRAVGLDWTFGPTLAIVSDNRWGRSYESYSQDPAIVRRYARAMVLGLQGKPGTAEFLDARHVIATPKHYLGDGGTRGVDQGDNTESEQQLRDSDGAGYPVAVAAGAQSIMVSFSSWQGVKMAANYGLLTEVLEDRWHFDGFAVGDWNAHGQVPGCTDSSCPQAVNAGLDMFMAPTDWKQLYSNTLQQARAGQISRSRLDDAVRRILRVKLRDRLLEEGPPASRPLAGHFDLLGSPQHRAIARRAVRESLVLLKNENHLLPLKPHERVLVAGDGADNIPMQCGGWTLTWQGTGTTNKDFPHGASIWEGIAQTVRAAGGEAELSADGRFKQKPDVAIVVYGENTYAEFQGDVPNLAFSPGNDSDLELLRRLRAAGIPVVSVFLSGRPLWVNPELNASNAFVEAWLPGSEGDGVADVLFRKPNGAIRYDFHGTLAFSWPRTPLQFGSDTPGQPLFALGYGLRDASHGNLAQLPEASGLPSAALVDNKVFFASGRTGAGWHWAVADDAGASPVGRGIGASDAGRLTLTATDRIKQEDSRQLRWSGTGQSTAEITGATAIDLTRQTNGQMALGFDYHVSEAPSAAVTVTMGCGASCSGTVPVTPALTDAPDGHWQHLDIPLACFAAAGANMRRVSTPFAVQTAGKLTLAISNIRVESGTAGSVACGH